MRILRQFLLLMWKNLTIHRRRFSSTAAECFLPTLFAFLLMILKLKSDNEFHDTSYFEKRPVGLPLFPKELGFVPKTKIVQSLVQSVLARHIQYLLSMPNNTGRSTKFVMPTMKGFNTMKEAELYFLGTNMEMTMVIELRHVEVSAKQLPNVLTVILHPYRKESQVWHTGSTHDTVFDRQPREDLGDQGFAYMETLVSRSILAMWLTASSKNASGADFLLNQKRFPVPKYMSHDLFQTLRLQLTLFMVLSFMMSVFMHTKNILYEKEFKIKESMRLMGMNLAAFWVSWFVTCFLFMIPAIFAFTLVLKIDFKDDGALLSYSDPTVIIVLLLCYSMSVVSFSMAITCMVNKGNEGVIVSGVVFLMEYVPYEIIYQHAHDLDRFSKIMSCISFNVAMGLANYNMLRREARSNITLVLVVISLSFRIRLIFILVWTIKKWILCCLGSGMLPLQLSFKRDVLMGFFMSHKFFLDYLKN